MEFCKRWLTLMMFYMLYLVFGIFAAFWGMNGGKFTGVIDEPWIFGLAVPILIFSVPVFYPLAIWGYVTNRPKVCKILTGLLTFCVVISTYFVWTYVTY